MTRQYVPARIAEQRRKKIEELKAEVRAMKRQLANIRQYAVSLESLKYHPTQDPAVIERIRKARKAL